MNPLDIPAAQDVLDAARRIENRVRRTPVLDDAHLDELSGARLHFKCENLQYGGAFKLRGAMNAVWSLSEAEASAEESTEDAGSMLDRIEGMSDEEVEELMRQSSESSGT